MPKLTIGMAHFDDFTGMWSTIQALRLYHADVMPDCEIIVVDNNPDSPHGRDAKHFVEGWVRNDVENARWINAKDVVGTAAPRDRIFREATGDAVLCMDCHVLLAPGATKKLIDYYAANPTTKDLLSGPMVYDDLEGMATQFDDVWRGQMWGVWGLDDRGRDSDAPPFEIPAMGLGVFSCRRDAWLGFNPGFRGFGGEEFYIHEKYRQNGHQCVCLPFLRWVHRFGRPGGVPFPLLQDEKVRNYMIGHRELGIPLDRCKEHFVESGMSEEQWQKIEAALDEEHKAEVKSDQGCGGCGKSKKLTLDQMYEQAVNTTSDINEHSEKLRELASQCEKVTEFGQRVHSSSVALLAGGPKRFTTYAADDAQRNALAKIATLGNGTQTLVTKGDSLNTTIEPTDMLFIDTWHTRDRLLAELQRHSPQVSRWIVMHDTEIYGEKGCDGGPGLLVALREFMQAEPQWSVVYHAENNNGLTVIGREPADKPTPPGPVKMLAHFSQAIASHVMDGARHVSQQTMSDRLEVCMMCDQRTEHQCALCGCPVEKKAKWRSEDCPIGKWSEAAVKETAT